YMSSETLVPDPFFRAFRITGSMKFNLKRLNEALADMDAGNVTVKKRGFPMLPEEVISKLRLKGTKHVTIVLTQELCGHVVYFVEPM
ncbi:SAM-dependent methyltransferase, partial [Candidatus Latescibacterota bacterium]